MHDSHRHETENAFDLLPSRVASLADDRTQELPMTVRIEKKGKVWTVIHSRPESRNAMDPESADALVAAFQQFDRDADAAVAVLWGEGGAVCAGWALKYRGTMIEDAKELHEIDYPLDERKP